MSSLFRYNFIVFVSLQTILKASYAGNILPIVDITLHCYYSDSNVMSIFGNAFVQQINKMIKHVKMGIFDGNGHHEYLSTILKKRFYRQ